jgi:hypothetical protein
MKRINVSRDYVEKNSSVKWKTRFIPETYNSPRNENLNLLVQIKFLGLFYI